MCDRLRKTTAVAAILSFVFLISACGMESDSSGPHAKQQQNQTHTSVTSKSSSIRSIDSSASSQFLSDSEQYPNPKAKETPEEPKTEKPKSKIKTTSPTAAPAKSEEKTQKVTLSAEVQADTTSHAANSPERASAPVTGSAVRQDGVVTPTAAPHVHDWVPVTETIQHPAETHVVHHDPVWTTVHHDAVTQEVPIYDYREICNVCGADISEDPGWHEVEICHGSYRTDAVQVGSKTETVKEAWDENVLVSAGWDETVVDRAAYTENKTTGYQCRGCGATK